MIPRAGWLKHGRIVRRRASIPTAHARAELPGDLRAPGSVGSGESPAHGGALTRRRGHRSGDVSSAVAGRARAGGSWAGGDGRLAPSHLHAPRARRAPLAVSRRHEASRARTRPSSRAPPWRRSPAPFRPTSSRPRSSRASTVDPMARSPRLSESPSERCGASYAASMNGSVACSTSRRSDHGTKLRGARCRSWRSASC
jgi:hypothetical protein